MQLIKNTRGSAILPALIAALLVITLSASLSTLNSGRGKAAIANAKKAAAANLAQIVAMHLASPELCEGRVTVLGDGLITPGNQGTGGIPLAVNIKYPLWKNNTNVTTGNFKTVPAHTNPSDRINSQVGDSSLFIDSISLRISTTGPNFDSGPNTLRTHSIPDGAGGATEIREYRGTLEIRIGDNGELPVPIGPTLMDFYIQVKPDNTFHSCSADTSIGDFCRQLGGSWNDIDENGAPLLNPECVFAPADVPACPDTVVGGRSFKQYIADFNSDGTPVCRPIVIDCSLGGTRPGFYLQGFNSSGSPICVAGGQTTQEINDCAAQDMSWTGTDGSLCSANTGGTVLNGANVNLTDITDPGQGAAIYSCNSGALSLQPGSTCTNTTTTPTTSIGSCTNISGGALTSQNGTPLEATFSSSGAFSGASACSAAEPPMGWSTYNSLSDCSSMTCPSTALCKVNPDQVLLGGGGGIAPIAGFGTCRPMVCRCPP